ncbi:unnamed protein product [Rotaria sp. Silwood1]|nr:unnamed protein product [Rotaria sp. Silwood1]
MLLARMGSKATRPIPDGNISSANNEIDLQYLLEDANCIRSVPVDAKHFNDDDYELLKKWSLHLCSPESARTSTELDPTFNTLIDEPMDARTLVNELVQNHTLKVYVIDSLKRYHSLMDIIHTLATFDELQDTEFPQQHRKTIESFHAIINKITKSVLLTTTIDSMSYESQRYFGNFIKKNDLPVPFAYYMWNKKNNILEYKINFNLLAEIMCLTNDHYILQVGSESAIGMGKTSLLHYIFPDKRVEALNTDGKSTRRHGCIDVIFSSQATNQKNESYIIFDTHGTINGLNEHIIRSIQANCALQILYVTAKDLESNFLNSMMNYSRQIQEKPTIIVIFDSDYDDTGNQKEKITGGFQSKYHDWKCVKWITAPCAQIWYQMDYDKKNNDMKRSQRLLRSFKAITESMDKEMQQSAICTSIFSIQCVYLTVQNLENFNPSINHYFEIQNRLKELFDNLNDNTDNLQIATPVSYLNSAIKQCERELSDNWDAPQMEIQAKRDNLIHARSQITTINKYTAFFINLLTRCLYIELLITEKYLEKWRSQFEAKLHDQIAQVKSEASKFNSKIKRLEGHLSGKENLSKEYATKLQQDLVAAKTEFRKQSIFINEIDKKLMNIDLTIGLFCDEIMALYELSPHLFDGKNCIQDIAKNLANLMLKGLAIHILRGRPLHCYSKLVEESIKFIPITQKPPLVLTVIGEQSSAKSSLMNTTFGCNFRVSAGRCTIGMYMSVVQWRLETIVILDTEGLLSLEEADSIFDNQMVTMAMLSSTNLL